MPRRRGQLFDASRCQQAHLIQSCLIRDRLAINFKANDGQGLITNFDYYSVTVCKLA
jgi:hypothetical protein